VTAPACPWLGGSDGARGGPVSSVVDQHVEAPDPLRLEAGVARSESGPLLEVWPSGVGAKCPRLQDVWLTRPPPPSAAVLEC
jgi:hypothetical protein